MNNLPIYKNILKRPLVLLVLLIGLIKTNSVLAQADYIPFGDKQYQLLDRLKIKLKDYPSLNLTTVKMVDRGEFTHILEKITELDKAGELGVSLTDIDRNDIRNVLMNNQDYASAPYQDSFKVEKPLLNFFFPTPAHVYQYLGDDFSFVADAVINMQVGHSSDGQKIFQNTRAFRVRGKIEDRIGFYALIAENQERDPLYVQNVVNRGYGIIGLPNVAFYKDWDGHAGAYDYFNIRGGVSFNAGKKVDFQLAYDQFQIGDGFRSLFISNYGAPFFYLRANVHISDKVGLTSVGAQTIAPFSNNPVRGANARDSTRPRSYMMFHHLDWQATSFLRLGVFENTIFNGSVNATDPTAIVNTDPTQGPVSSVEKGNTARSRVGIDFRAIPTTNVELYGQWLIDGLTKFGTSFDNRNAFQLGAKYIDAFGIQNLNLQAETNIVRPYAYAADNVENNYTHYNMPLAHPVGSNFREMVGILSYHPLKRVYLNIKGILYKKGLDKDGLNYGGDLLRPFTYNKPTEAFAIGSGIKNTVSYLNATASYELLQNLYIDGNFTYRKSKLDVGGTTNLNFYSFGLRWNMPHRDYDF